MKDYMMILTCRGIPEGVAFNKSGECIEYKQTDTSCNAGLFPFIENLRPDGMYKKSDTYKLINEIAMMRTLKGQPVQGFDATSYDFLLFIYWTRFEGKLNKDHEKEWQQLASANKNAIIKTVLVDLDIQEN